jgi:lipopolysaccharide transport protein LptA/LPS export ABC transporter protein LptC
MSRWQRRARLVIAVFALAFLVVLALAFKRRTAGVQPAAVVPTEQGAVVVSTGGETKRFSSSREDVNVRYERLLTYADGSSKLMGVTIATDDRHGKSFTITGKEGKVGQGEATMTLDGDVRLTGSDGMTVRAEHATYTDSDGTVQSSGPVEFGRGRMSGSGVGLKYEKGRDILWIPERAVVHVAADEKGAGAAEITAGSVTFARRDHYVQFERDVRIRRDGRTIEADAAVARLSTDDTRIETLELHNHARISGGGGGAGSLQSLVGNDMTLNYAADGESLQHALVIGEASVELAGDAGKAGRRVAAKTLDIVMAPDGTTPVALTGREAVQLKFPPDGDTPERTIDAANLDAKGEPGRGLTRALFTGGVQFREHGGAVDRAASSSTLEVVMKPGMATIDEARFQHAVRFEEGAMTAQAAAARYDLTKGTLELTGSEPAAVIPRVVNERIAVDAVRIDVTLEGPQVTAAGTVKSTLQPARKDPKSDAKVDVKMPSMLKQDQPVTVLGDSLTYDGTHGTATYTGNSRLFQGDTTVKGDSITIDEKRGDLTALGHAMTTSTREQAGKDKKKERMQSTATSKDMKYEDNVRRLTYTGAAHVVGPEGDMSAAKIELYLKPSGDELERAEAYADATDKMTLREQNRTTTGAHMTYTADRETYVVDGLPATVVDECGRQTIGRTLTFVKATDTIVVDGNQQIRTQTKGGTGKCQ